MSRPLPGLASCGVRLPTMVTSRPSRIQTVPSPMTIIQCQRDQGSRSSLAGTLVVMVPVSTSLMSTTGYLPRARQTSGLDRLHHPGPRPGSAVPVAPAEIPGAHVAPSGRAQGVLVLGDVPDVGEEQQPAGPQHAVRLAHGAVPIGGGQAVQGERGSTTSNRSSGNGRAASREVTSPAGTPSASALTRAGAGSEESTPIAWPVVSRRAARTSRAPRPLPRSSTSSSPLSRASSPSQTANLPRRAVYRWLAALASV